MIAYIGPGMSGGLLAAIIGIIASVALAIVGVVYYPLKRSLKSVLSKRR